jgi:hypothetical protein
VLRGGSRSFLYGKRTVNSVGFSRVPENSWSGWSQTAEGFYVAYNSIDKQN